MPVARRCLTQRSNRSSSSLLCRRVDKASRQHASALRQSYRDVNPFIRAPAGTSSSPMSRVKRRVRYAGLERRYERRRACVLVCGVARTAHSARSDVGVDARPTDDVARRRSMPKLTDAASAQSIDDECVARGFRSIVAGVAARSIAPFALLQMVHGFCC